MNEGRYTLCLNLSNLNKVVLIEITVFSVHRIKILIIICFNLIILLIKPIPLLLIVK